jgi:hypothetical protein
MGSVVKEDIQWLVVFPPNSCHGYEPLLSHEGLRFL